MIAAEKITLPLLTEGRTNKVNYIVFSLPKRGYRIHKNQSLADRTYLFKELNISPTKNDQRILKYIYTWQLQAVFIRHG